MAYTYSKREEQYELYKFLEKSDHVSSMYDV